MSLEFNLIQEYFTRPTHHTALGVGDDAALINVSSGMQLAISSDMLVAGTHFFHNALPFDIGWKSLAVNISDMAAMGAEAKWATLAIALPNYAQANNVTAPIINATTDSLSSPVITPHWLAEFSRGFFACADAFNVDLIGGDTTRGPLTICVTIMGETPSDPELKRHSFKQGGFKNSGFKRSGAQIDDDIWISGNLGSAALGLANLQAQLTLPANALKACLQALHLPMPHAQLGLALRGIASSCIDLSDGLLADLGHIVKASHCGATIDLEAIPCIDYLKDHLNIAQYQGYLLAGGDDYVLCFTAPIIKREAIKALALAFKLPISCIGSIKMANQLKLADIQINYKNNEIYLQKHGYDHFG